MKGIGIIYLAAYLISEVGGEVQVLVMTGEVETAAYYDYVIRKGNPVGLIQGYKSQGFYTVDDFNVGADGIWTLKPGIPDNVDNIGNFAGAENYKRPDGQKAFPGMAKFADTDNDGKITASDVTIIGKTKPQHTD